MRIPHSGPSCVVCEYAMGYLHEELESASVKKDIEALVENLCSHLPSAFKNEVCFWSEIYFAMVFAVIYSISSFLGK